MRRFPLQTTALLSGRFRATDPNTGRSAEASTRAGALALLFSARPCIPVPHSSAAADGQRSTPSDPVAGAKSDGIPVPASDGAGPWPESHCRQGSQAVTLSPSSEPSSSPAETKAADAPPPASAVTHSRLAAAPLPVSSEPQVTASAETAATDAPAAPPASVAQFKRTAADFRPHCQHPDACGSSKLAHCRSCAAAAGLLEVAA